MNYNRNERTIKLNGSELCNLYELFKNESSNKVIPALSVAYHEYPYIFDSKSKIEISFTEKEVLIKLYPSTYRCKNENSR